MTTVDEQETGIARHGEPRYEAATQVFNLAAPAAPAAAATVRTVGQIRAAIAYAVAENLRVRVHTTGHGSATAGPMEDALLLRTLLPGGVDIDPRARVARVPAGTCWGEVVEAAAPYGLAAPHGSSPLVGVAGYVLRGGVSLYGRHTGLAANSVRAIELVTADGELRRADASSDPELLWALRGGGGGFGVVTAVEIDLFAAERVVTGAAYWPAAHAHRLLPLWLRWTRDAPRKVTTTLRVMNLPSLPEIPEPLRAGTVLCVDGVVLGEADDPAAAGRLAEDLLGPLRAVAEPVFDTWQEATPREVVRTHMDPTEPFPIFGDHMLLGDLPEEAIAEFLALVGEGSGSPLTNAELRQLGGALAVPDGEGGALDRLDARFAYIGGGVPFGGLTPDILVGHCARVRAALGRWDTGLTAPSFVENVTQPQRHLSQEKVAAVDRVRARLDPSGRFRGDIAPNASAGQRAPGSPGNASAG
ncbi:FAD-binding protein [Streptosporangium sp. NPDC051023]|uniref:FAD-binding oxidoreductase n=1 Tax=Streptosporangium sp. NPDC051023 TaxID=3155410 RepID=UPI003450E231